jgi:nitrile hydratase
VALYGTARLPDAVAACHPEESEPVYAVRFDARDLWGAGSHTVTIELWRSYLEV